VMAVNPSLLPSEVVSVLETTSVDLGAGGYDYYYGYGRVNAGAAVQAAVQSSPVVAQPPVVSITSPTGGTVTGTVPVNVSASDSLGVTRVDLLVNGALFASDTTAPYAFSWDSTPFTDTSVTLAARAYDAAGASATSEPVTVSVASGSGPTPGPPTSPPTISITNPADGATVNGMVMIAVTASAPAGIASTSLYVDGNLVKTGNTASLFYKWNSRKAGSGSHTISATVMDTAGNSATATIQVTR